MSSRTVVALWSTSAILAGFHIAYHTPFSAFLSVWIGLVAIGIEQIKEE